MADLQRVNLNIGGAVRSELLFEVVKEFKRKELFDDFDFSIDAFIHYKTFKMEARRLYQHHSNSQMELISYNVDSMSSELLAWHIKLLHKHNINYDVVATDDEAGMKFFFRRDKLRLALSMRPEDLFSKAKSACWTNLIPGALGPLRIVYDTPLQVS